VNLAPSEAEIQRAIMDLLRVHRVFALRINSGAIPDKTGRPVFFARWMDGKPACGISDLVLLRDGRVTFMELKTAKGKQRKSQIEFEQWALLAGARYVVVRSVEDAERWVRQRP